MSDRGESDGTSTSGVRTSGPDTRKERPQHESSTSSECTLIDSIQVQIPGRGDQLRNVTSPSDSELHMDGNEEVVITSMRANDVTLGLRRLPAGFYAVVHHGGLEWRTEVKRPSVNQDVDWSKPIPIPSDLSAIVCLEVYASFEFQPVLGDGERLRKLRITVKQLLDCSAKHVPFILYPEAGDVVSPCSSIFVIVRRRQRESCDSSTLGPHRTVTESRGGLEDATNRGHRALSRYQRHGEKHDLERSIEHFERALDMCLVEHPCHAAAQVNLAVAKSILSRVEDADISLEVPLHLYNNALATRPVGHFDRPSTLIQLAAVHFARFEKGRDKIELAQAETLLHEAVELSPMGSHENRVATFMLLLHANHTLDPTQIDANLSVEHHSTSRITYLDILGVQMLRQFKRFGRLADLQLAIGILLRLVGSTPVHNDAYRTGLATLGLALSCRFDHLGELSDLDDAISRQSEAVDLVPHGHPDKPGYLNSLGTSLVVRFQRLRTLSDLEDAISMQKDAVSFTPHGHPCKPTYLSDLGDTLTTRFKHFMELSDLQTAISMFRNAVNLTAHGHPDKPCHLTRLGKSLTARFQYLGERSDIEEAISMLRDAADLTPHGHPNLPSNLTNLGNSLLARFTRLGDRGELNDLEEVISLFKSALGLTPHDHPNKPGCLTILGVSFRIRFEYLGELSDLEDAISAQRDAVDLTPHGHPNMPDNLTNLANTFIRFMRFRQPRDLEDVISMPKDVVDPIPRSRPDKSTSLSNLGDYFKTRFEHLGELADLEDAISSLRDAIELTPDGHPDKSRCLQLLGTSFQARFKRLGQPTDLEVAISTLRDTINLTPHGHADRPSYLIDLSDSIFTRFECLGEPCDLEDAISLYLHVASVPIFPTTVRFFASQKWIACARQTRHYTLLHAYSVCLTVVPDLSWMGLSLKDHYSKVKQGADIVREAAAAALDSGFPETAVEWLEKGRSIIWVKALQLHSPYQELSSAHPDYARRLREFSATCEQLLSADLGLAQSAAHDASYSLQQAAEKYHMLVTGRNELLQEIRRLPGFEQFHLYQFSHIRTSAHSGPVVILNAAESRCDALIILANVDHVIHVPLPNFTWRRAMGIQNMVKALLGHTRDAGFDDRKGNRAIRRGFNWESILSTLWNVVVKPVLNAMAISIPGDLSRIFWSPTGPFTFLPIHAAGLYGTQYLLPGHKISDFVVSSYIPIVTILGLQSNPSVKHGEHFRLLTVCQPPTDGLPHLRGVHIELEHIKDVIRNSPSVQTALLESSTGSVEEVLDLMKEADWVHFACHGIQDSAKPTESGLCLADGRRLKISDMLVLSRPRGGLAFLSACQTAMGDEHLVDEAIHIAAGMLFAGYGGVVGTMWSISDKLAPGVARDVYEQLLQNGTSPDYREAARALHNAIGRLRDSGKASFATWLPFIHVGL